MNNYDAKKKTNFFQCVFKSQKIKIKKKNPINQFDLSLIDKDKKYDGCYGSIYEIFGNQY